MLQDEKMYTEKEKNELIEKAILKVHYAHFKEIEMFIDKSIDAKLQDFCQKNPEINHLIEKKETPIAYCKE